MNDGKSFPASGTFHSFLSRLHEMTFSLDVILKKKKWYWRSCCSPFFCLAHPKDTQVQPWSKLYWRHAPSTETPKYKWRKKGGRCLPAFKKKKTKYTAHEIYLFFSRLFYADEAPFSSSFLSHKSLAISLFPFWQRPKRSKTAEADLGSISLYFFSICQGFELVLKLSSVSSSVLS